MARRFTWGAATSVAALVVGGLTLTAAPQAQAADWSRCLTGSTDRQAVFERASAVSGVPVEVLLGVSYLESRWDDHGVRSAPRAATAPCTSPRTRPRPMPAQLAKAKGDGSPPPSRPARSPRPRR